MTILSSEPARWSCDSCQRMSDFDSCQFTLIRMAYINDRLVSICSRYNVTFDISLRAGGGGGTLRHNQIFSDG